MTAFVNGSRRYFDELDYEFPLCKSCEKPCRVRVVDFGIGFYEYCGAPGYDEQLCAVSNCCESDVEDGDKHRCEICQAMFVSEDALDAHDAGHTEDER